MKKWWHNYLGKAVVGTEGGGGRIPQQLDCEMARPLRPILWRTALAALPRSTQHKLVHLQPVWPHCTQVSQIISPLLPPKKLLTDRSPSKLALSSLVIPDTDKLQVLTS